jgi:hypothetical protein
LRYLYLYCHDKVAKRILHLVYRKPFPFQSNFRFWLRSGLYFYLHLTIERIYRCVTTQDGSVQPYIDRRVEIISEPLEMGILFNDKRNVEVSGRPSVNSRLTIPGQFYFLAVRHPCRNGNTDILSVNVQSLLMCLHCLTERQPQFGPVIPAPVPATGVSGLPLREPTPEHRTEEIGKIAIGEIIPGVKSVSCLLLRFLILFTVLPVFTILVVFGPFFRVAQHLVGFIQQRAFGYLDELTSGACSSDRLQEILTFTENELCIAPNRSFADEGQLREYLIAKLDRPFRVCGMVKNVGEPGGGPFIVENPDGTASLQILESSQIDENDEKAVAAFRNGSHFNPVDLVCGVRCYKNNKFDLTRFVDKNTGFISQKSKNGKELKALELPGLWNGAMSDWNTVFVEVPLTTFNPVKTVNDLLRPEHQ